MALRRLCKSADSDDRDRCPAVYVCDDPTGMVAQGKFLDDGTAAEMQAVGDDEGGVALPTETVLRAAALFLAEQGRPTMRADVEDFLAHWDGAR